MLTYDTPALRQTGSRNMTGKKNFELLPILTDYCKLEKGGMKLKKNSPLKLLNQSQPNFGS
jgi:hypothetical protein